MNTIDKTLDLLEKLIRLCKFQQKEIIELKREIKDNHQVISDLKIKWQNELDRRLSGK